MGIKNLSKFIKTKFPNSLYIIPISNLKFKRIAFDTSLFLCKYKALYGINWRDAFIKLIAFLRSEQIHPIFVFDGKAPNEKNDEKDKRRLAKQKLENDLLHMIESLEYYKNTGIINNTLKELNKISKYPSRLLGKDKININNIEDHIENKKRQIINISSDDISSLKELISLLGVKIIQAGGEAEKMCSKLCKDNEVDIACSEDTDLIAYITPYIISKIDITNRTCTLIDMENLLKQMSYSEEQLLDFCIMCGTDYNNNITKIGNMTAYNLIKDNKSIENIPTNIDTSILKYENVRKLFLDFNDCIYENIPYTSPIDYENLILYMNKFNINIDIIWLKKMTKQNIVFEE